MLSDVDTPPLTPARIRLAFSGLALALMLAALDQSVVATAMPTIVTDLGGLEHIAWLVTAYLAAVIVATPISGKLGDIYGRRTVFLVAVVVFIVGSMLCGVAQSLNQLIAFRAVQGFGGGALLALAVAMSADLVSPRELGRYQGYFGAAFGAASVFGPLVGGFFTEELSWRWIFYINLPIGAVCFAIVAYAFRVPVRRQVRPFDYAGTMLVAVAVVAVVLVLSWGGTQYPWRSSTILVLAFAGLLATLLFIAVERRAADPLLPLGLYRDSTFTLANAASFFVGFGMFGAIAFLPLFLQVVRGANPTNSGLLLLPMMLGLIVSALVSGALITKTGKYKLFPIAGPAVAGFGMYLMSTMGPTTPRSVITLYMAIVGIGVGLCLQVLVLIAQNTAQPEVVGVATSSVAFIRTIGGLVGVAVLGAVFTRRLTAELATVAPGTPINLPRQSGATVPTQALANLPPDLRAGYVQSFADALTEAYLWTVPAFGAAAVLAVMLRQVPMRQEVITAEPASQSG